jgi:hypothetical protein
VSHAFNEPLPLTFPPHLLCVTELDNLPEEENLMDELFSFHGEAYRILHVVSRSFTAPNAVHILDFV